MNITATKSSTDHLCDFCELEFHTCPSQPDDVKFGNGPGGDNVIECSEFAHSGNYTSGIYDKYIDA